MYHLWSVKHWAVQQPVAAALLEYRGVVPLVARAIKRWMSECGPESAQERGYQVVRRRRRHQADRPMPHEGWLVVTEYE